MKRKVPKHNGVTLDPSGKPVSKYARKQAEKKKAPHGFSRETILAQNHYVNEMAKRFGRVPINGQHLGERE